MQKLLYADLGGSTLADTLASAGSNWPWPTLIQGTKLKLGFRLVEEVEGEFVEVDREVTSIRAKIGELYAKPGTGTYRIHIGPIEDEPVEGVNLTAEISVLANAAAVQTALNNTSIVGTTYGVATVTEADGSYFATFADETEPVPLRGANIRTDVISFLRIWASEMDGVWTHEIRPDKAGLAFADNIIEELPAAPVVTTFRPGVDNGDGTGINEIQKIAFNPKFRGIYEVRWSDRKSPLLSRDDGPDQFGEAIAVLADEDGEFIVTNPSSNIGMVEFSGSMGNQPQADLEIAVVDNPPADRYVVLDLGTKTAADFLRQAELDDADEIDLPLEVEIRYQDPADEDLILVWFYQETVTVRRRLTREGEATTNDTDYTRPVNARSYRPFNASQVAAGVHFYPFELGDGVNAAHTVDHGLGTLLVEVNLWENQTGGRFLVHGTDFTVAYDDEGPGEDAVVVTLLGDYATAGVGELSGCVIGREQVSHFEGDTTWEMEQINGLVDELDAMKARLLALEALAPGALAALALGSKGTSSKPVPHFAFLYPMLGRSAIALPAPGARLSTLDLSTLPRVAPRIYPAVHDASVEALPTVVEGGIRIPSEPTLSNVNKVYENQTSDNVELAIGTGWTLLPGQFAATDGETWYPVERYSNSESSYYPAYLARVLFEDMVQPDELPAGSEMELRWPIELAMLMANTPLHCTIALEVATITADTTPGTPGANLATQSWAATPVQEQRLIVTASPREYVLGYRVRRAANGTLSADKLVFGNWVSTTAPAAAAFQIRARLLRVDTPNTVAAPEGIIALAGGVPFEDGTSPDTSANVGFLTIRS